MLCNKCLPLSTNISNFHQRVLWWKILIVAKSGISLLDVEDSVWLGYLRNVIYLIRNIIISSFRSSSLIHIFCLSITVAFSHFDGIRSLNWNNCVQMQKCPEKLKTMNVSEKMSVFSFSNFSSAPKKSSSYLLSSTVLHQLYIHDLAESNRCLSQMGLACDPVDGGDRCACYYLPHDRPAER